MAFYSDESAVRLRFGFRTREVKSGSQAESAGTILKLDEASVEPEIGVAGIIEIRKNGVEIFSPAGFTFKEPFIITLATPAIDSDNFVILFGSKLEQNVLLDVLTAAADTIDGIVKRSYGEAALRRWKTRRIDHDTPSGTFTVGEIVSNGASPPALGQVVIVDPSFITITPLDGPIFADGQTLTGEDSGVTAVINFPTGVSVPISLANRQIAEIAKQLAGCYAWEAFWDIHHTTDPEEEKRIMEKKRMLYAKLDYIDKGKIKLVGENSLGSTDRPSIGRGGTGPFKKRQDLEEFDWFLDYEFSGTPTGRGNRR